MTEESARLCEHVLARRSVDRLPEVDVAGPGWDPVTGWGSPNAQVLIPLLARG